MPNPLVSIVVCTHNRAGFLKQTMETIFAQQYEPVEIVVIDDGSTDNTAELIKGYGDKVRYYRQEKKGIAVARTIGCQMAQGEYIAFQDDDDLMPPDRIRCLYEALCRYPGAVLAVGDWAIIDVNGNLTGERNRARMPITDEEAMLIEDGYSAILWPKLTPGPPSTLFKKSDGERNGWFDTRFFHGCSDTDFFARLGQLGPIVYVPKIVCYYRFGHNQIWGNSILGEYSRVLIFEKHISSLGSGSKDLKKRLQVRLLTSLEGIALLRRNGERMPHPIPADYLDRVLPLLGLRDRLHYIVFTTLRLPLRKLIKG